MDIGLQRLQPFLVGDAEFLLLVDDDQAEALERHRFGEQRMGADDDIDRSVFKPRTRLCGIACRPQPRYLPNLDRIAGTAVPNGRVILEPTRGGRTDKTYLHAVHPTANP